MQSPNKRAPTAIERKHIALVKSMPCIVCGTAGPSDAHEIVQSHWFTSLSLCKDCHTGSHNGIHGRRSMWNVKKLNEIAALNLMVQALLYGRHV
jgi:hypothetical protein